MAGPYRPLLILLGLLMALCVACQPAPKPPELLTLTEVVPRLVSAGDRLEVRGIGLPVGEVQSARVVFRGDLHRPGLAVLHGVEIEVDDAHVERDRIWLELHELSAERFTGRGDDARRATFRGDVEVWLPGTRRGLPVYGTLKGTTVLNVEPQLVGQGVSQELARHATALFAYWGVALETDQAGVTLSRVDANGRAANAGLAAGDRVIAANGVEVRTASDLAVAEGQQEAVMVVSRGDVTSRVTIDTANFRPLGGASWTGGVALLAAGLLVSLLFASRLGGVLTWLAHRLARREARRRGRGWLSAVFSDAMQENESAARSLVSLMAPVLVFFVTTLTFAAIPAVELAGRSGLDIGVLYLVSLTSFVSMGLVTGGWNGNSKRGLWARIQALLGMLACELPALAALLAVVMQTGSLGVRDIVLGQSASLGTPLETGSMPWHWNAVRSPQLFVLFIFFFATVLVDGHHKQLSGADGRHEERSLRRGLFFFAEWTNTFVMCAIGAICFLGGYGVPGLPADMLAQGGVWRGLAIGTFVLKCWGLAGLVLLARSAMPSMRVSTLVRIGWLRMAPAVAVVCALAAALLRYPPLPSVERAVSITTLLVSSGAALAVLVSVRAMRGRKPGRLVRVNTML